MRLANKLTIKAMIIGLTIFLAVFAFAESAFAQTPPTPRPTPVPSGSNPVQYAPTDVPVDISLFWVLAFFTFLGVWLILANFLTRSRVLSDQIDQPADSQPMAGMK